MNTEATARVLDIRGLRVTYRGRQHGQSVVAVDGVDLRVPEGEIVGLVGESGSGKSTLALAAAGLVRVNSGVVDLLGNDIAGMSTRELRRLRSRFQIVFQDPHGSLDPRQTVQGGLSELRRLHRRTTDWISDEELLGRVGLTPDVLGRLPHQLSGGQAQRVAIARALLLKPALLIADEPTSGLDVSVQAHIMNLLMRLSEEEGIALLIISHDLSIVRHTCGYVYVMEQGLVVESGPTERVLQSPTHEYTRSLISAIPGKAISDIAACVDLGEFVRRIATASPAYEPEKTS